MPNETKNSLLKSGPELALILNTLQAHAPHGRSLFIDPTINWSLFYRLVRRHRVWHPVRKALIPVNHSESTIPIAQALSNHCQRDQRRILITAGETIRIARAFEKKAIAHCFVKGTLLNVHLYGGLNTRPCKDIDVWVDANTYAEAMATLIELGYQKTYPTYDLTGFKEAYYLSHKHDLAFTHPTLHVVVELHFKLNYFGIDFFPLNTVPLSRIGLLNVPILAPEDHYHLLYLMIHGSIHAWLRLRWLHDIALFIDSNRCDLNDVWRLAGLLKCQHIVEQTLILVNTLFSTHHSALAPFIQSPSRRAMRLASLAQQLIGSGYEMTDGVSNIKMFIKYRFYLAKLAIHGKKIQAIWGDLFKIDMLFPTMTVPKRLSFLYYLAYPFWIMRLIWKSISIESISQK